MKPILSQFQALQQSRKRRSSDEHYRNGIGLRRKFKVTDQGPFRRMSILPHKVPWSAAFMRTLVLHIAHGMLRPASK